MSNYASSATINTNTRASKIHHRRYAGKDSKRSSSTEQTPLIHPTNSNNNNNTSSTTNDSGGGGYNDPIEDMTYARRGARLLSQFKWYFPNSGSAANDWYDPLSSSTTTEEDGSSPPTTNTVTLSYPELDKAWETFEHIGLPRCFKYDKDATHSIGLHRNRKITTTNSPTAASTGTKDKRKLGTYNRAEPGETSKPTMLYPVWSTPLVDMGDFGIGVGLYFSALQYFAIMTFLAGVINIPAMVYLHSNQYSPVGRGGLDRLLTVSAVCTETAWVPCPTCSTQTQQTTTDHHALLAFGIAADGITPLPFIRVNNCSLTTVFGVSTYGSLLFVVVAMYCINWFQMKRAVELDEAVQTTQDYSIKINNPPPNAKNPTDWKTFFEQTFHNNSSNNSTTTNNSKNNLHLHVNAVTIVLNNATLLKPLIKRQKLLGQLQNMLPIGIPFDDTTNLEEVLMHCRRPPIPLWKRLLEVVRSKDTVDDAMDDSSDENPTKAEMIVEEVRQIEQEITAFATTNCAFDVTSVFVTFDTEEAQRHVLEELTVPRMKESQLDDSFKYEGRVLRVLEPDEPDSIRWPDLDETYFTKAKQQVTTLFITFCIIMGGRSLIICADQKGPKYISFAIILCNLLAPHIVRKLTSYESHRNESLRTASQYLKITAFRWSITVFIPLLITAFPTMLDREGIIKNVMVLLLAECIQRPIIQLIGIGGFLKRHVFGPRAEDQRRMDLWYAGDPYFISERYTDVTKVLLLVLFYCILYPVGYFFASLIFSIYYWVDKFLILRSWKQGPMIGTSVARLSSHFFKLCLIAYAVVAAMFYTQFPYDNACPSGGDGEDLSAYTGDIDVTVHRGGGTETIFNVTGLEGYRFCNQEISIGMDRVETMSTSKSQNFFSSAFRHTALAIMILVLATFVYRAFKVFVYPLFYKSYKAHGEAGKQKFLEVSQIEAYVPQAKIPGFAFPFLFCYRTNVRDEHIGWRDPQKGYEEHCLISNFKQILERNDVKMDDTTIKLMFSSVEVFESS